MDLAAPEMVRVAKEAYTYEYELRLRKEQDEGELRGELASLRETRSAISAEIATYQAQIDTARERETNRANASARERMVEPRARPTPTQPCLRHRPLTFVPSAARRRRRSLSTASSRTFWSGSPRSRTGCRR
jgi:hypothetical protein